MANVMFKRGSQAKLNELTSFVDGAFYLTTDTDRLYVAQSSTELVELNKSITIVDSLGDLPTATTDTTKKIKGSDVAVGQFYYVKTGSDSVSGNILAVCSAITGTAISWTQVNPDTNDNDNDSVSGFTIDKKEIDDEGNLVYTYTLSQKDITGKALPNITGTFKILEEDIATLGGIKVGLVKSVIGNKATVNTDGSGADSEKTVAITGGDNITIASTTDGFSIAAKDTTYDINSPAGAATIVSKNVDDNSTDTITFKGDTSYIEVSGATKDQIDIKHKNSGVTAGTYGEDKAKSIDATERTFDAPKVTVDAAGHVTSIESITYTLPNDDDTTYTVEEISASTAANETGKLKISVKDSEGKEVGKTSDRILYNKITIDGTEKTVYNSEDLGSFYSADEIDKLMIGLNAMTYKGTVGTAEGATITALPTTNVKIGDTYMACSEGAGISGSSIGDLFIASGTENENGVLPSDGITWTHVNSGYDTDTTYTLTAANNKVNLTASTGGTSSVTLEDDEVVTLTGSGNKVTAAHADSGVEASIYSSNTKSTLEYSGKFTIPKLTINAKGHVTAAEDIEITLPASDNSRYALGGAEKAVELREGTGDEAPGTGAAVTGKITFDDGTVTTSEVSTTGNNITVKYNHNNIERNDTTAIGSTLDYSGDFTVVTGVTSNEQGHITAVTTKKYTLPASDDTTYTLSGTTTAATNGVKVSTVLTDSANKDTKHEYNITSNSLTISAGTNSVKAEIEWGNF